HTLGSIRKAAAEIKMSYQQAWSLVDQMNSRNGNPLVISKRGGKGGGQALLTDEGLQKIALFRKFNEEFQLFLSNFNSISQEN
ncbi:MAG: LysR family transcriptional regulator, partial [Cytophagales bacterium]|nr:LysR family transcriptional regulator [Cytophagales bacterium]